MLRSLLSVLSRVRGRVHGSDFGRMVVAGLLVWVWVVGCESSDSGIDTHPRDGEPCIRGVDRTCCINEFYALSCESGSWGVLADLPDGCPCSNATFCGGLAPLCPGAPDNYSLPPDAQ